MTQQLSVAALKSLIAHEKATGDPHVTLLFSHYFDDQIIRSVSH